MARWPNRRQSRAIAAVYAIFFVFALALFSVAVAFQGMPHWLLWLPLGPAVGILFFLVIGQVQK